MSGVADSMALVDAIIQEFHNEPIDLLGIGNAGDESDYLEHARHSYVRTLRDVLPIAETLQLERPSIRILEIGAYFGVVSCALAKLGFSVTALDIPEFMENRRLAARYARHGVSTLTANLRNDPLPAASGSFDMVIMCETLEHLNFNPLPIIAEINRVMAQGGELYLSLPNQASLVNRAKLLLGRSIHNPIADFAAQFSRECNMIVGIHWREYTASELEELVSWGGFGIESHYFSTMHKPSLPARLAYLLFPRLRGNQTLVARKTGAAPAVSHLYHATR